MTPAASSPIEWKIIIFHNASSDQNVLKKQIFKLWSALTTIKSGIQIWEKDRLNAETSY